MLTQNLFVYISNGATDELAPLTSYSRNGGRKFLGSYRAGRQVPIEGVKYNIFTILSTQYEMNTC